jgi:hypothetical protein
MAAQAKLKAITSEPKPNPAELLDPVIALAMELSDYEDRYIDAEAFSAVQSDISRKIKADCAREEAYSRIESLREAATTIQARTIPGALFHLSLLSIITSDYGENEHTEGEKKDLERKINRLMYSIAEVLRAHACGITPLSDLYMPDRLNPWKIVSRSKIDLDVESKW